MTSIWGKPIISIHLSHQRTSSPVCVYICVYMYVFIDLYMNIHIYTYTYVYICTWKIYAHQQWEPIHTHPCAPSTDYPTNMCIYIHIHVRMYVCTYICIYVCMSYISKEKTIPTHVSTERNYSYPSICAFKEPSRL